MLESDRLDILSWTWAEGEPLAQPMRRVLDFETGDVVGAVRHEGTPTGSRWTWTRPSRLILMEAEIDGLSRLASMRRLWLSWRRWKVYDADDQIIGLIRDGNIQDPLGYRFAWTQPNDDGGWTFCDCTGREYATWKAEAGLDRLEWLRPRVTNPFLRMLVLGVVLGRNSAPAPPQRVGETGGA